MLLCGTDSGRAVLGKPVVQTKRRHPWVASLIREGSDQLERGADLGQRKKPGAPFGSRPLPVAGAVRFDRKLYGITKREGRVWGTAGSCHTWSEAEDPAAAGGIWLCRMPWHQKKKAPFGALFFWCGRWDSNPHTEVLASKTRASTIPPLPLISLWPCTFTKQQADKYPYYTIFSLGLSIPRPVPTVRGLPVYRRCVRIES